MFGSIALAFAIAAAVSAAVTGFLVISGLADRIMDLPNHRSMHTRPTPRVGGIGILVGMTAAMAFYASGAQWNLILISLALGALSFFDDLWSLPVYVRFPAHFAAAVLFVVLFPSPSIFLMVFVVLAAMWVTNLYNFMDGLDGLSGGMTVFGFLAYAIAAALGHALDLALLSVSLAGAAVGFLFFNWHPAKTFMGDSGAIALGFLAAALGYLGVIGQVWPFWFPFLAFLPFIADATVTLFRRLFAGEKVWEAHRTHYYQRMAAQFGQPRTLGIWYAAMAATAIVALGLLAAAPVTVAVVLAGCAILYLGALIQLNRILR